MKKRWSALLITALLLALGLSGCGASGNGAKAGSTEPAAKKLQVVGTMFPQYDFASQVGGDRAQVSMLLKPGSESHSYEPTPQDIIKIRNCDVFIYTGGESDTWVKDVLESMDTSKMKVISLMDCVSVVEEEEKEGMEPEAKEGTDGEAKAKAKAEAESGQPEYDEHVWTNPQNAVKITAAIGKAFDQVDPKNAEYYDGNVEHFTADLNQLDADFKAVVSQGKRKTLVFGDRFPLRYFVDAYGLDYWAAFPGCSTDTEPSAATIAFLIDKVKSEQIPVVFQIELSSGAMAKSISEATGAKVRTFYTCHNISKEDFDSGETYLTQMRKNVATLKEALN